MPEFQRAITAGVGASFKVVGTLIRSPAEGQKYELQVKDPTKHQLVILGEADKQSYPLAKTRPKLETLREICHLRPRTNLIGATIRIRNNLAFATHEFFNKRGFLYIHTPLITASDCEGAGEMF